VDPTRAMVEEGRLLGGGIIRRPCLLESIYQRPLKIRLPFGNASVTVQDPEGLRCYEERAGRLPWGVVSAWPRRPAWGAPPRSGPLSQKAHVSRCSSARSQSQQREDLSPAGLGVDQELSLSAFDLLAPS
jgi:hypothetical protein